MSKSEEDHTLEELEEKGPEFHSLDNGDHKMQTAREEKVYIENLVSKETSHMMDLIVSPLPKRRFRSSEEKCIFPEVAKED